MRQEHAEKLIRFVTAGITGATLVSVAVAGVLLVSAKTPARSVPALSAAAELNAPVSALTTPAARKP